MSDEAPQAPQPPKPPSAKTSTVPLKKETVRITLRAKPGEGIDPAAPAAGAAAPAPPKPAAAPPKPPTAAPKPAAAAPAPAAPAAKGGDMHKTQKVTVKAVPSAASPGKTIPLSSVKQPGAAAAVGATTGALPKATVKLQQPTQALSTPAPGAEKSGAFETASSSVVLEEEDEGSNLYFAIAAAVLGVAALVVAMMSSDVVGLSVPEAKNPAWEKSTGKGYTSTFGTTLPEVPVYK